MVARIRPARDLTKESVSRLLLSLSIPTTIQWVLSTGSGLVLAWWLGQLGRTALASSAAATALQLVIISPMMGLSSGGQAIAGRFLGAGETEQADRTVAQCMLLLLVMVSICSVIGLLGAETFLGWMGYEGAVLEEAIIYSKVVFSGLLVLEMLPSMNGVILAAGRPLYTMLMYGIQLGATAALMPLLVPARGIQGAALAVVLGSAAAVIAQLVILFGGFAGMKLRLRDMAPDWLLMRRILGIAIPTSAQRFVPNIREAVLVALVTALGDIPLAAFGLLWRIMSFTLAPAYGLSGPAASLVGQNIGACYPNRAAKAANLSTILAIIATALLQLLLILFPEAILGYFTSETVTIEAARAVLPFSLLIAVGHGWNRVMATVLSAAADATANLVLTTISVVGLQLGLAWLFSQPLGWGVQGLWLGAAIGAIASGVFLSLRFAQDKWRDCFI